MVEKVRELLSIVKVQEQLVPKIKIETKSRWIHSLLKFDGGKLGIEEIRKMLEDDPYRDERVEDVAERVGVAAKEKDLQLVVNIINCDKFIDQLVYMTEKFREMTFGEKDLVAINSLLGERLVEKSRLGEFRASVQSDSTSVFFSMNYVTPVEIPFQMSDFWKWYSGSRESGYGLFVAGVVLYEIVRIAPFEKENVLTGLMMTRYLMQKFGFGFDGMICWEEEMLKNKEVFWMKVKEVDREMGDMRSWLEFFVGCVADGVTRLRSKAMMSLGQVPEFRTRSNRKIELSSRQELIMEELSVKGRASLKEIKGLLPDISEDTVLREIKNLMAKKIIKKKGKTRGAVYLLAKNLEY